jgi:hypothetical protein
MHKIWKFKDSKSNKIILIKDKIIYKGNPKELDLNSINNTTTDFTFVKNLFSIPYSYIKKIENENGKNYIKIFFGKDSEEELYIDDENIKNEIFEYIKFENQNLKYSFKTPSTISYIKTQLLALFALTCIFIVSLYYATEIENGAEYKYIGGTPGLLDFIFLIANIGTIKIIFSYIIITTFIILKMIFKLKHRSETKVLER